MYTWRRHRVQTFSAILVLCEVKSLAIGIPSQSANNAQLWHLLCCSTEQTTEQTAELTVIWDAMALMWCRRKVKLKLRPRVWVQNLVWNYANPVYSVSTICHQVRCLRRGGGGGGGGGGGILVSLSYSHVFFIWYKTFRMRDISCGFIWMEFINMLSVYTQSGTHRRFDWWIMAVLT